MTKLRISTKLSLPIDAVTSTIVVYGGKGMGKTNLASVLVEEFAAARLRFAVIDPMGVWWGLRHSADGKGHGIEVLILGGIHGDLPIEPSSGAVVADLIVDEDVSIIVDISRRPDGSMWSISERISFVATFAKRVYQRQGEKRRPLHLVIDEAARFAPQIVRQGELEVAKCMGAVAVIVEEGRNVGIGVTLVTQRSARLNKDVAELADCMIAFRIVGPNSMRAVLDWLGEHVDKGRLKEISLQLRELPRGSALVVSPGWLEFEGIVPMRMRETFDSSATPKPGQQVRASGSGAKPDLAKYTERLAEVVERQKANDPKALKARVVELEKQLAAKVPAANVETKTIEKVVIKDAQLTRIEGLADRTMAVAAAVKESIRTFVERVESSASKLEAEAEMLRAAIATTRQPQNIPAARPQPTSRPASAIAAKPAATREIRRPNIPAGDGSLSRPQLELLTALAWWNAMGHPAPTKAQVAAKAGWKVKGSHLRNRLAELSALGLITYPQSGTVALTSEGLSRAPQADTSKSLLDSIRAVLTHPQTEAFEALLAGGAQDKTALGERIGWDPSGSHLRNRLAELSAMELVEYPRRGSAQLQAWVTA